MGMRLGAFAIAGLLAATTPQQNAWIPLFNGRNLDGWEAKIKGYDRGDNFGETFRVEAGVIKVSYDKYGDFGGRFGHLFYKDEFSHYRLRVEYRFVGQQATGGPEWALRNSGVMVHGEPIAAMTRDQEFPTSIEVQFLGGNGKDPRPTSNVCTPGTNIVIDGKLVTRHCTNSTSATYHGDQWVTAEVEVCGSKSITHYLDGKPVMTYGGPQLDDRDAHAKTLATQRSGLLLERGTISLQSESHPVEFRRVELRVLDAAACGAAGAGAQETTTPVWSTPDRFWFRLPAPGGNEWWTVDARSGARERLFDHQRLAIELSEQSKRAYTPLTLPFADPASEFVVKYDGSNAALQEGALAIEFSFDDERWRCELQGEWDWGRKPPSDYYCAPAEGAAAPASGAGPVRSPDGKWEAFISNSNVAVRPSGGAVRMLSADGTPAAPYHLGSLRWSRDSRTISGYRMHSDAWRSPSSVDNIKTLITVRDWAVPPK